jgi:hypothetical protein
MPMRRAVPFEFSSLSAAVSPVMKRVPIALRD